ncbi:MAG: iron ABC transporter permease [Puniceicoccales bacterium]|jgi:iron(III) transport system permease protein|nr:iron ABC transporter permease [Puniceicoccales bacterium]
MTKFFSLLVFGLTVVFLGCFFLWPIWQMLQGGFINTDGRFTLGFFRLAFENPIYVRGLLNAITFAGASTAVALLIALPLAYFADRYEFLGKRFFTGIILLPLILPPFVGAIGVQQILGTHGTLNAALIHLGWMDAAHPYDWLGHYKFLGMVILNALGLFPVLYLNLVAALANLDPSLEEAAGSLGCRGLRRFFKITFPLMSPGIFAGCTLAFIWSFTELGIPLIFDYNRILPVQIYFGLKDIGNNPLPYALTSIMLVFSVAFYAVGKILFGRHHFAMMARATQVSGPRRIPWWKQGGCALLFAGVTFAALLPHAAVVIKSFAADWYSTLLPQFWTGHNFQIALGHPLTIPAIRNSLLYASCATGVALLLGIAVAFVVVRTKLPGRHILDTLTMLPLAVPGLVMAFGYLSMSQRGQAFAFLNPVENPTVLLIIAYAVRKLPFMVRSAVAGLQQTSISYEEAAQSLGCPPLRASLKITLPLVMANLTAGGLLVFSQTMLEVSDSIILAQKQQFYPITKAIYELLHTLADGPYLACALGVWAMLFLGITILGLSSLLGKNLGSIFRV